MLSRAWGWSRREEDQWLVARPGYAYGLVRASLLPCSGEVRAMEDQRLAVHRTIVVVDVGPAHGPGAWFSARLKDGSSPDGADLAH